MYHLDFIGLLTTEPSYPNLQISQKEENRGDYLKCATVVVKSDPGTYLCLGLIENCVKDLYEYYLLKIYKYIFITFFYIKTMFIEMTCAAGTVFKFIFQQVKLLVFGLQRQVPESQ